MIGILVKGGGEIWTETRIEGRQYKETTERKWSPRNQEEKPGADPSVTASAERTSTVHT